MKTEKEIGGFMRPCPACNGTGTEKDEFFHTVVCSACNGYGFYEPEEENSSSEVPATEPITEFTLGRPHGASFHAWRGRR